MPHGAEYHDGVCAGFTLFPERCRMSIRHSSEFGIVDTRIQVSFGLLEPICNRLISNGVGGHLLILYGTVRHFLSSPYCARILFVRDRPFVGLDVSSVRHPVPAC
jgi:hypothetical protein